MKTKETKDGMEKGTTARRSRDKGNRLGGASAEGTAAVRPNGVKRRTFVRMKKIFGWLHDGLYPNCTSIARDLEVSVRTAERDVDCLRDEWELPIGYDEKRHGFHFTEKVDRLPWVPVTEAELFAVCISSKVLELYDGMPFQKPLELAFAKMDAWLTDILRGRRLHPSQVVEEMRGGGSRLRLRLSCLEEIEQYVLSWGAHASVIEPRELRGRLGAVARTLAARYGDAGMGNPNAETPGQPKPHKSEL